MTRTYILTAEMDPTSFAWLDGLRRAHFPAERNFLPAHITMFHRISGTHVANLGSFTLPCVPIAVRFDAVAYLGSGVAFRISSPDLQMLRDTAMLAMGGEFSRQDRQRWKPHVTIQNKVPSEAARQLHREMESMFVERAGLVTGLLVWEYLGGPWRLVRRIAFSTRS